MNLTECFRVLLIKSFVKILLNIMPIFFSFSGHSNFSSVCTCREVALKIVF